MNECPVCGICVDDQCRACPKDSVPLEKPFDGLPLLDGKYRLERRLGRGGMGAVYRTQHQELQKLFALKVILPKKSHNEEFLRRFRIEAKALGRLNHPNIVQVTDFGVDTRSFGLPYLVMEYLEGIKLSAFVRSGPVPPDIALPILYSIARALDHAHACGIIHRDLKPDNVILLRRPAGTFHVKVLDFGLARFFDTGEAKPGATSWEGLGDTETMDVGSSLSELSQDLSAVSGGSITTPGTLVGTPGYLAPEMCLGQAVPRSDMYSFGVLVYEVLTGRRPFSGTVPQLLHQHLAVRPALPSSICPSVPRDVDPLIMEALEKVPEKRPESCRNLVEKIKHIYDENNIKLWKIKNIIPRAAIAAGLACLGVLLGLILGQWPISQLLEHKLADLRFYLAPARPLDRRIQLVRIPEDYWDNRDNRDLDEFVRRARQTFDAGAAGIGIDFLMPPRCGTHEGFVKLVLDHRERLVLAVVTTQNRQVTGTESVAGFITFALGPAGAARLFGFINVDEDEDRVIRRFRPEYRDRNDALVPSFSLRAARMLGGAEPRPPGAGQPLWIDFSRDWRANTIEWEDFPAVMAARGGDFRGAFVLFGVRSELFQDMHQVPNPAGLPGRIAGMNIQAIMLQTLLSPGAVREPDTAAQWSFWFAAYLLAGLGVLWTQRPAGMLAVVLAGGLLFAGCALGAFVWGRWMVAVVIPLVGLGTASGLAWWLRRRLASCPPPIGLGEERIGAPVPVRPPEAGRKQDPEGDVTTK